LGNHTNEEVRIAGKCVITMMGCPESTLYGIHNGFSLLEAITDVGIPSAQYPHHADVNCSLDITWSRSKNRNLHVP
jgi:hypothetical protein